MAELIAPEILKAIRGKLRVPSGVNVLVPEAMLQRSRIMTIVGELCSRKHAAACAGGSRGRAPLAGRSLCLTAATHCDG